MATPQVDITTWYLEMTRPPAASDARPHPEGLRIERCLSPTLSYYLYLYNTIGERWAWAERRLQTADEIRELLAAPWFRLFVPSLHGVPAGMVEVHARNFPEVELKYFGLMPEFIGKGIGLATLFWTVEQVFAEGAMRLWLHTCTQDSPNALPVYQKAGFTIFDEKHHAVPDPAHQGVFGDNRPRYWVD